MAKRQSRQPLSPFHNDQTWTDQQGTVHQLTAMTSAHRRNLLAYLEDNARTFYRQATGTAYDGHDPVEWIRATPLFVTLAKLEGLACKHGWLNADPRWCPSCADEAMDPYQ